MSNHERQNYIITGASGNLGQAVVRSLSQQGAHLFLIGRNQQRLEELQASNPERISTYHGDLSDPQIAGAAVAAAAKQYDTIHGLVHLIGQFARGPVRTSPPGLYQAVLEANFLTAVYMTQALLGSLAGGARLIYLSSFQAHDPLRNMGAYSASKAALVAWARTVAQELHPHVRVNVVSTTMLDTPQARMRLQERAMDYLVSPAELAEMITLLLSPTGYVLNGAVIPVYKNFHLEDTIFG
jgi:NAD(P)-dependent dehydrogenase (short-subunit alcohol dehydrogenase family)